MEHDKKRSKVRGQRSKVGTKVLAFGLSAIFCAGLVRAQERPDFSGRWTAEPVTGAAADMGSGWGSPITITHTPSQLTVEYAFFGRGDMQAPLKFVYALDGRETKNSVMLGRGRQIQTSRTAWKGRALVITTAHLLVDGGKPATVEVTQTLTLESPTSLVVETTRAGVFGGPPSTSRATHKKS